MNNFINVFEMSPRDGLQNEKNFISTKDKIKFINKLSSCGFKKIETSSFVSPKWVPQLSDALKVFRGINRAEEIKYTALTPNEKGFDNALEAKVDEVAIFTAASETFNKKNLLFFGVRVSFSSICGRIFGNIKFPLASGIIHVSDFAKNRSFAPSLVMKSCNGPHTACKLEKKHSITL